MTKFVCLPLLFLVTATACTEQFGGSNLQIDFASTVRAQDFPGLPLVEGHVPYNAHFRLYALNEVYDAGGAVSASSSFEVMRFEIQPGLDLASPCLIDNDPRSTTRGVHILQYAERVGADLGIPDITNPPAGASEADQVKAATARARVDRAVANAGGLKAVVSASSATYPAAGTACPGEVGFDASLIPPASCMDDEANRIRLATCQAFWDANPDYYEANDLTITAPHNGVNYGLVLGINPTNQSVTGATQFFVDSVLAGFEGYAIHWQYDDANGDGEPDYPAGTLDAAKPPLGFQFMYGNPAMTTRGVQRVQLRSINNTTVRATMAIFADLNTDQVNF